jgi:predicted dehydrogenase
MTSPTTRRGFMQISAAASAGYWVAGGVTSSSAKQPGPNERVNIALVGAGGQGASNLRSLLARNNNASRDVGGLVNIVAFCEVDDVRGAETYRAHPRVPRWVDFRAMLERQRDIDAVLVAIPDHNHAHVAITAMRMGKHCYCEKPLTHDIWEARQMKEVAASNRVATQMGNHGTAGNDLRRAIEIVQSGAIGDVREVHIWTNRPIWPQNINRPTGNMATPATLNWNQWLGTAPQRPYNSAYAPFNWRGWWDYGTGALGDMGCHTMNMPFRALKLGLPTSVVAELTTPLNPETGPEGCKVTFQFPARENMPAVTMYWYERRNPPANVLQGYEITRQRPSGSLLVGARGTLLSADDYGGRLQLLPADQFRDYRDPAPTLPRSPGHHREWIDAIRGGPPAMSNFVDYAALLTEVVLLGNVAIRCNGQQVNWNGTEMRATGLAEADPFIRRTYRTGFEL